MPRRTLAIALNGATGRMGYRQQLVRSILAIREQGGLALPDGTVVWPEPLLVGRDAQKLRAIAERHGLERWTTSLDEALADPAVEVYFDAQVTQQRVKALTKAIEAGKHVYTEKPTAETAAEALGLARTAAAAGVRHGVVQAKLFLPGLLKLKRLGDAGCLGRFLSVPGRSGCWVLAGRCPGAGPPAC